MAVGARTLLVNRRRRLAGEWLPGALSLVAVLFTTQGFAAQSARLVYSRGSETQACPAEDALRRAVANRLGYDPFVAVSNRTVVAEIRSEAHGLAARVYVITEGGTAGGARQLTAADRECTELLAAVALAISIAIDPEAMDRIASDDSKSAASGENNAGELGGPLPPAPLTTAPPAARVEPQPPPSAVIGKDTPDSLPTTRAVAALRRQIGAFASVANGPTPAPSVALGIGIGLSQGRVGFLLEPALLFPSTSQEGTARVRILGYGMGVGVGLRAGKWFAGIIGDFDMLVSKGQVAIPRSDRSWVMAAGPRLAFRMPAAHGWHVVAGVDGLIALRTVEMQVDGQSAFITPRTILRGRFALNYEW